ncbi:MAG: DNA replication/repair protein RecF, partial [Clostridia bacterium]|nr:DNA replication/repair protein RecF [Clostridia bacterium]
MNVSHVEYADWRNMSECSVSLGEGINVLWGMNAQGKSNILEGIYYFARGRSFRGAKDRELIRFGCDFTRAKLSFRRDGYENDTTLEAVIPKTGKKHLSRNGAPLASTSEMMGSFRAVLFCPAHRTMVTGGPLERRTFLDIALSQLSQTYLTYLRRYTKVLAERNMLLKNAASGTRVTETEWDVYARQLALYGSWIAAYRAEYVTYLSEAVARYFDGMTGGRETPDVTYTSHGLTDGMPTPLSNMAEEPSQSQDALYEKLTTNIDREIIVGSTLWGTHKDDIRLALNGKEAKLYASQGQQRSIVLSIKLAEAEISKKIGGEYPAILLDDVFSELDESRRNYILGSL